MLFVLFILAFVIEFIYEHFYDVTIANIVYLVINVHYALLIGYLASKYNHEICNNSPQMHFTRFISLTT